MGIDQRRAETGSPFTLRDLAAESMLLHDGVLYRRPDAGGGEHHLLEELQGDIWDPRVVTPSHQLIAAESCGGLLLGAYRGREVVGLSYAFPAHHGGRVWLHSHQTGVRDGSRNRGVGATLKWLQRWLALQEGYTTVSWTFDPLQSRNAYFNFSKLGAVARTYRADYYGRLPDPSNRDLPTDRLWVEWHLDSAAVAERFAAYRASTGVTWPHLPPIGPPSTDGSSPGRSSGPSPRVELFSTRRSAAGQRLPADVGSDAPSLDASAPVLHLEVPGDLEAVRRQGRACAAAWRTAVRHAFTAAFDRGYVATDFVSTSTRGERRSWYVLTRPEV